MFNSESRLKKLTLALLGKAKGVCPAYSSKFSKKTYTQHQLIILLCLRKKLKQDYRDAVDTISLMPEILGLLGLKCVPHFTTLSKAFKRLSSRNWRTQKKEVYVLCILHNIERQLSVIWIGFQQSFQTHKYSLFKGQEYNFSLCIKFSRLTTK